MANYAVSIVTYEISAVVSELAGFFEWCKADKKEGVARFCSLVTSLRSNDFQDNYLSPILNL
jgi:hypothetical protein